MPRYSPGMGVRGFPLTSALSSNITHDEFTKENLTKTFSSEKFIETNNVFATRGKKTLPISLSA